MKKRFTSKCIPYLFLLPTMITLFLFLYLSIGVAFVTALTDKVANPNAVTHFVGLANFKTMLSDSVFRLSFQNQLLLSVCSVTFNIIFPLLAAVLLHFVRKQRLQYLMKTLFVLPMLVPSIVVILIWKFLFNLNFGINSFLDLIHLSGLKHNWLNESETALKCAIMVGFPFVSGMYFLLFHSGLNGINGSIYDAAQVDGATSLDVVWRIQIPIILPYIRIVAMLSLISSLSTFGQISALTDGGPGYSSVIPALYMYKIAFGDGKQGYSSALGIALFAIILVTTVLINKLFTARRENR